jgi:hypothetical protein
MKYSYSILICIILIASIIIYNSLTKDKTGFQNYTTKWSPDLIRRFNIYQTTINQNVNQFDLVQLQRQASSEEAEEYLKTGFWPWTDDLKNMYIENVRSNPIIKIDPHHALNYAMTVYNKNAVTELLAWNTKEGQFLLYGGDLGVSDGMPKDVNNTLKCSTDSLDSSVIKKKIYTGMNLDNGYMNSTTTIVKPEDIPKEMPGFSFVKGPCNPCIAFNSPGDFTCPFKLNVKGDDRISEPWEKLWNLQDIVTTGT